MKNIRIEISNEISEIPYEEGKKRYQLLFFLSITVAVISLLFLFWNFYQYRQKEKVSKELLEHYHLTTLYSDNSSYDASTLENNVIQNPFVIGMIKIDKIGLNYPILSESNDELLRISLCRFDGPMPNKSGNLCIAGHNYMDNRFFGRLYELNLGDKIELYDLSGQKKIYKITEKFEVTASDLSCTKQNVGNEKMITLLTCDNSSQNKRLVIQGKIAK